ncbi:putative transporter [Actibacterium sp. D379-3]
MTSFLNLSDIALSVVALAVAGALGLLLGKVEVKGVGLGIGGVLFSGIAVGHVSSAMGLEYDAHVLEFVREFGLILFVYTIGVQVGPGFFASLQKTGLRLNIAAASIVLLGVAVTVGIFFLFDVPVPVLVGLMSGAVTNTPGLGAATQVLADLGAGPETMALPSLGYAVAYPFGILGILLTMLLVRFVLGISIEDEAAAYEKERRAGDSALPSLNVVVKNPNLNGLTLSEVPDLFDAGVVASRMKKGTELIVPTRATVVHTGDVLHLVGSSDKLRAMRIILGEETDAALTTKGTRLTWARLVVTDTKVLGHRLRSLALEESHGVTISRIYRAGVELPAQADSTLQFGDIVTVVGESEEIDAVKCVLGDQKGRLEQLQFAAVFVGIALGVILGSLPILIPGLPAPLKLGLAGGPLVVAILLGRLGHFGPFVWFMPPVANHALRELGIVLFLAVVGIRAGDRFLETLIFGDGLTWIAYGIAITLIPLLIVGFAARLLGKFNYLSLSGVLAGSMTDPPALAFAVAMNPAQAASIAYASVYPLVMCMRILAPQLLVLLLM